MQKFCYLLLLALFPLLTHAQAGLNSYDLLDVSQNRPFSATNLNKATAEDEARLAAEGKELEHYYSPDWLPGAITKANGEVLPVSGLRYNLMHQWVEAQDGSVPGHIRLYPLGSLRGMTMDATPGYTPTRFNAYRVRGQEGRRLMQELTAVGSGPLHLLLQYEIEMQPAVRNAGLNLETQPAQLLRLTHLYAATVATGQYQAEAEEVSLNEKQVLRLFGTSAATLAAYAKQNALSFHNLDDVLKLVEWYNALKTKAAN